MLCRMQRVMGREGVGVIAVDRFQDRLLFARHEGRVARAPFVIVAQQVENSMDEEAPEFLAEAVS